MESDVGGIGESMETVLLSLAPRLMCGMETDMAEAGRLYGVLPTVTVLDSRRGPKKKVAV
jgi:hypothetical protein